jgi:hypothetical protein
MMRGSNHRRSLSEEMAELLPRRFCIEILEVVAGRERQRNLKLSARKLEEESGDDAICPLS